MFNRETVEAPTSTFTLLEKARTGDEAALSRAFDQYRRRLAVLIHFKLDARESGDVEDVLQETYLKAFRGLDGFEYRSPGSFLRWLSSIADSVMGSGVDDELLDFIVTTAGRLQLVNANPRR